MRGSVYFTPTMLEQLKNLTDRLSGVSHSDKANSWIPGKISKPSLDTFGGWLEGRFTKLVTGESDGSALPQEDAVKQGGGHGPFTHYNTISSATNSARSSPAPSFVTPAHALPPRTGSAMSNKTSYVYGSATDLVKRKRSPGPAAPVSPAVMPTSATLPSFPSIQAQLGNYHNGSINEYSPGLELPTPKRSVNHDTDYAGDEVTAQEVTWWGSSGGGHHNNNNGKTPTAAKFEKVEEMHGGVDNEGFFSPMMSSSFVIGSTSVGTQASRPGQAASYVEQDEEDDLGLGNSTKKEESVKSESGSEKDKVSAAPVEARKSGVCFSCPSIILDLFNIGSYYKMLLNQIQDGSPAGGAVRRIRLVDLLKPIWEKKVRFIMTKNSNAGSIRRYLFVLPVQGHGE